jgi:hypothetical protein
MGPCSNFALFHQFRTYHVTPQLLPVFAFVLEIHFSTFTVTQPHSPLSVCTYTCTGVLQRVVTMMPFCFTLRATIWRCTRVLSTTFICHLGSFYRIATNTNPLSLLMSKTCLRLIWTLFTQLNGTNSSWAIVRC